MQRPLRLAYQAVSIAGSAHPVGIPIMVSVTVWPVVHDLSVVDQPYGVYLPEDDSAIKRVSQPVAQCRFLYLLLGKVAAEDHGTAEVAVIRQSLLPHRPWVSRPVVAQPVAQGTECIRVEFADFH